MDWFVDELMVLHQQRQVSFGYGFGPKGSSCLAEVEMVLQRLMIEVLVMVIDLRMI
jgi:hypothetical protein